MPIASVRGHAGHRHQPYAPSVGSPARWTRNSQHTISTPDLAEFIGGPLTSSLSLESRANIILSMLPGIPPPTISTMFSETLDAVVFLGTGIQPSTKLNTLCDSLQQLTDLCQTEYTARCCENILLTNALVEMVTSCCTQSHQVGLVEAAESVGFQAFDAAPVAEGSFDITTLENEIRLLTRRVQHAELKALAAAHLEKAALLALRAASLEWTTAEERAMIPPHHTGTLCRHGF